MRMLGLTKRQFLKRSKEALKETGIQILIFRELVDQEAKKKINKEDARRKLDNIRRDVENTFSLFEKLNPPSNCLSLQRRILSTLIIFHESVVSYSDYLIADEEGSDEESRNKLKESREQLQEFRENFLSLSREVDLNLRKK